MGILPIRSVGHYWHEPHLRRILTAYFGYYQEQALLTEQDRVTGLSARGWPCTLHSKPCGVYSGTCTRH
jgi:hypothetical protein